MKLDRFEYIGSDSDPNNIAKLIKNIGFLPENTLVGLSQNDKTPVEFRKEYVLSEKECVLSEEREFISIQPKIHIGEKLIVNYPEGAINQRASRECACFTYRNINYKVIF
mgnify:CR=1 FL=1